MSFADWTSLGTAVGTLALAVATFILALVTTSSAKTSQQLVKLEQEQLREAYLPLVVLRADSISIDFLPTMPESTEHVMQVRVAVVNIGVGPALAVHMRLYWIYSEGAPKRAPMLRQSPAPLGGLPTGEHDVFIAKFGNSDRYAHSLPDLQIEVTFADTAGTTYKSAGTYSCSDEQLSSVTLSTLDEHGNRVKTRAM